VHPYQDSIGGSEFFFTTTEDIAVVQWSYHVANDSPGRFQIVFSGQGMEYSASNYGPVGDGSICVLGAGWYSGGMFTRQDSTGISVRVYQLVP